MQPKKRYHGSLELHLQIFVPYYSEYKVNITMNADFKLNFKWRKILSIGSSWKWKKDKFGQQNALHTFWETFWGITKSTHLTFLGAQVVAVWVVQTRSCPTHCFSVHQTTSTSPPVPVLSSPAWPSDPPPPKINSVYCIQYIVYLT